MTIPDLKGQLIARLNNLDSVGRNLVAEIAQAEAELKRLRSEAAAVHGAQGELRAVLALLDAPETATSAAPGGVPPAARQPLAPEIVRQRL